jgi:hypothetical protein
MRKEFLSTNLYDGSHLEDDEDNERIFMYIL